MSNLPKGNYNVVISDAVIAKVGEAAAMKCVTMVSRDIDKHCRLIKTQFGHSLYCQCKGSMGTVLGVMIYEENGSNVIDCRLPHEFGFGN